MKNAYVSKEQVEAIAKEYPTPFYLYDEKGIRALKSTLPLRQPLILLFYGF